MTMTIAEPESVAAEVEAVRLAPQQRLAWQRMESGLLPDSAAWTVADLCVTAPVSLEALAGSLKAAVCDEEILRTEFRAMASMRVPFQIFLPRPRLTLSVEEGVAGAGAERSARESFRAALAERGRNGVLAGDVMASIWPEAGGAIRLLLAFSALAVDDAGALILAARALDHAQNGSVVEPVQYADVSEWLLELYEAESADAAAAFWEERLATAEEARVRVPFAREASGGFAPESVSDALQPGMREQVRELAEAWRLPEGGVWLACHAALLHLYSGAETVTLGLRSDGRDSEELATVVGRLARVVPVRATIAEDTRLRGLAAEAALTISRTADRAEYWPPVQAPVLLPHQFASFADQSWPEGIDRSRSSLVDGAEPFLTRLVLDGETVRLDYDSARLSPEAARLVLRQFAEIAADAVANPDARVRALSPKAGVAPAAVRESGRLTIAERITSQARRTPLRTALRMGDDRLDYAALDARADAIGRALVGKGVRPDDRVVLSTRKSLEQIAAYIGIWRSGAACVPLDPKSPVERLAAILADADPALIVSDEWPESITGDCPVVRPEALSPDDPGAALPAALAKAPAYLIYTSGTTGTPKGVVVSHAALSSYVDGVAPRLALSEEAELAALAGLDVDLGYTALFAALGTGRTLRVLPDEAATDPDVLLSALRGRPLACLKIVPQHFAGLIGGLDDEEARALIPTDCLVFGGDRLEPDVVAEMRRLRPDCRIVNHYGPTETTIGVLTAAIDGRSPPYPIGAPLAPVEALILDPAGKPVADGIAGELWIGGGTLSSGYHANPAQTADRFRPHPWSSEPGALLYRTGDLVRRLEDGSIAFLGRVDHQVKLRGVRIELGEIEAALRALDGVDEAVVSVVRTEAAEGLVAFVKASPDARLLLPDVQKQLLNRLPQTMIPQRLVEVAAFDRTPGGKIDRRRLADRIPDSEAPDGAPARNPVEAALVEIIAALVGSPRFGVHDNFFAAGGDSIVSIQVAAQARRRGVEISANMLFQHQTVAELAAAAAAPTQMVAEQGPVIGAVPMLPIQLRYFAHRRHALHHHNQSMLLAGDGLDDAAFVRALASLFAHHDMLRAGYRHDAAGWHQHLTAEVDAAAAFRRIDLAHLDAAGRTAAIRAAAAEHQASLDLENGPLFKALWMEFGGEGRLLLVAHHLIVDAVSWHVLLEDLIALYLAEAAGSTYALPPKTSAFRDFALSLATPPVSGEQEFWANQQPAEPPPPPEPGLAGGSNSFGAARTASFSLGAEETQTLLATSRDPLGGSILELLAGAVGAAVSRWTGAPTVTLELEGHGRQAPDASIDVSRTAGWFTARYPVRLAAEGGDPAAFARAAKGVLRAVPRGGIGYGLLSTGTPDRELPLAGAVVPFISLNYLGQVRGAAAGDGPFRIVMDEHGPERAPDGEREHLISINVQIVDGLLAVQLTYAGGHVSEATADRIGQDILSGLRVLGRANPRDALMTAADFPLAGFADDGALKLWLAERRIEDATDIYPLSQLQLAMAVHALTMPDSGVYLLQLVMEVTGALDEARLRNAWSSVAARHPALRTSLHDLDGERPLQVVHAQPSAPWKSIDWSMVAGEEAERRVDQLLYADRTEGFDFTQAPLMRFACIRLAGGRHIFVWSRHHAIVDGWSSAQILQQVFALYDGGEALAPAAPFRDYIAWLGSHGERAASLAFWSDYLAGFDSATPLRIDPASGEFGTGSAEDLELVLDPELGQALQAFVRHNHVTLNTVMRTAWGIALARHAGTTEAVFGTTVSGRPDSLAGVEAIVGPFINTVPARVTLPENGVAVGEWLKALQAGQARADDHVHLPLTDIQRASGIPGDSPLFETLFIFENFPIDRSGLQGDGLAGRITAARTLDKTGYPLTLLVSASEQVSVRLSYNPSQISETEVSGLRSLYEQAVRALVQGDSAALAALAPAGGTVLERRAALEAAAAPFAISATFAPDPLVPIVAYWARLLGHRLRIDHVANGRLFQDLLDPEGMIAQAQASLILLRWTDLVAVEGADPDAIAAELGEALRQAAARGSGQLIVALCPPPPGQGESFCAAADRVLRSRLEGVAGVDLVEARAAFEAWGVTEPDDEEAERLAGIPFTPQAYAALGMAAARAYDAQHRVPYKVIALDCDNTLWGGICGEAGADGVDVGGGWADFQRFLVEKRSQGFLICLCSRNNLDDVREVFETREMPLTLDMVAAFRIGWGSKAAYLGEMAEELGLGIESFLFLDDDAANALEVERLTGASAIVSPTDPAQLSAFAHRLWPLDKSRLSSEDLARADQYAVERERRTLLDSADDGALDSFVAALGVEIDVQPLAEPDLDRAADLSQRTNQFNLTMRRRTLGELRSELAAGRFRGSVVRVSDRFGDYGLVGVILYRAERGTLEVDTFLLSCRALARGVEQSMARHLADVAETLGCDRVAFRLIEGSRNQPAQDFFAALPDEAADDDPMLRTVGLEALRSFTLTTRQRGAAPRSAPARSDREEAARKAYAELARSLRTADQIVAAAAPARERQLARPPYAEAENDIEHLLASFYQDLFEIADVGRNDSFFGLGGNSLQAVQLAGRIRRTLTSHVQLRVVFENPTVAGLAAEIALMIDPAEDDADIEVMEF
jgi:amino acid adenylation domain-containing protein/FkbH-like protein/non-ribosomal peptide synthase protein (TIGR01720 family)